MNSPLSSLLKFYCAARRILVKIYSDSSRNLVGIYCFSYSTRLLFWRISNRFQG